MKNKLIIALLIASMAVSVTACGKSDKDTTEAVDYILRGWPIRPEIRKVGKAYDFSLPQTPVPARVPNVIDKINALDNKIEHPESLKFSVVV